MPAWCKLITPMAFRCILRVLSWPMLMCIVAATSAAADELPRSMLTKAGDIKRLTTAEAAEAVPVRLQGVIIHGPDTYGPVRDGGELLPGGGEAEDEFVCLELSFLLRESFREDRPWHGRRVGFWPGAFRDHLQCGTTTW